MDPNQNSLAQLPGAATSLVGHDEYEGGAQYYDRVFEPLLGHIRRALRSWVDVHAVGRALDLGCGTGKQLALLHGSGERWGINLSPAMLAQARQQVPGRCLRGDVSRVPFVDGAFDLVYCQFALHEKSAQVIADLLGEAQRLLKPGGHLLVTDYSLPGGVNPLAHVVGQGIRFIEWRAGAEHYGNYRDWMQRGGIDGILTRAGWQRVSSQPFYLGNISMNAYQPAEGG